MALDQSQVLLQNGSQVHVASLVTNTSSVVFEFETNQYYRR